MESTGALPVPFFEMMEKRVLEVDSLLCVGLDPHKKQLAEATPAAAKAFCLRIIELTHPHAAAFKPNAAFFEAFGPEGIAALHEVIAAVPPGIPVLLDGKRGDISTTAEAYADAAYNVAHAHAVTVNAYMGADAVEPFTRDPSKGVFVLCRTSNPSAVDLQEQTLSDGFSVYAHVARLARNWNAERKNVGLVVGATDVSALSRVRFCAPELWILAPGVGAQGADLRECVLAGIRADRMGLLVAVSRYDAVQAETEAHRMYRGVYTADPAQSARELKDDINRIRGAGTIDVQGGALDVHMLQPHQTEFVKLCLEMHVLKFGSFTLKSGRISPYFFNAGLFCSGPSILKLGSYYAKAIVSSGMEFDVLFGPAYKGIPLVTSIAMRLYAEYGISVDVSYNRKEVKDHGEGGALVGADVQGRRVLVVDDVITAGTAIRETMALLTPAGAHVVGLVLALDRQEKMSETSVMSAVQSVTNEFGIPVFSVCGLRDLMAFISQSMTASPDSQAKFNMTQSTLEALMQYNAIYGV